MVQKLLEFLPQFIGAALILFVGWIVARTVRSLTLRLANSFDSLSKYSGLGTILGSWSVNKPVVAILGNAIFWLVILFFVTAATNLLGLNMFAGWLDRLIGHLPNILSGALLIVAGIVFGNLVNDATRTAAHSLAARQRSLLARSAQAFTVATMIVIGVD